ncbi:hypothetical protein CASFOL_012393 [Castilleja foliolosa]|uniref:MATH domain-containing protein n=1 Tax=Castilleja foliolosa TaxID=1961234 RepID=A0ABD3DGY9_9LAMI
MYIDDSFCSIFGVVKKIKRSFANKSQALPEEKVGSALTAAADEARLVIYPNAHGTGNDDKDYVSVYLAITNTSALPSNWEVNATFSICLFNHSSGNCPYSLGRAQRFHALKQEWDFNKFISKKDLTDPSNGYVVDDKFVFGAEVFVNENKAVTECMSAKSIGKDPYKWEFKISNFSELKDKWVSEEFTVGGNKWVIDAYPNGLGKQSGRSLSIFLHHVVYEHCSSSQRVRTWFCWNYVLNLKCNSQQYLVDC